jgi:adenylylsulfate kinase
MAGQAQSGKYNRMINSTDRIRIKNHDPVVLWLTGLSGSGKTTLANAVEYHLNQEYHAHTYFLDGDVIRTGLNKDLDLSPAGRSENIRRAGEVARLFFDAGLVVITAFISPYRADRSFVRSLLPSGCFIEVYLNCPLEVCEKRDPKGLYKKARAGSIQNFTGISAAYEPPENPELEIDTSSITLDESVDRVVSYLKSHQFIR